MFLPIHVFAGLISAPRHAVPPRSRYGDSFELSFDGPFCAIQFDRNFGVRGPLKFEQHDLLHRLVRNSIEQLNATFRDFGQHSGRLLVSNDRVDPGVTEFSKTRFTAYGAPASFLPFQLPQLC